VPGIIPKLSATPGALRTTAPKLGEHTDEILRALGYSAQDISGFREKNIIG
jgi:formyl-CoA transferase